MADLQLHYNGATGWHNTHPLSPRVALYIPGGAVHGVPVVSGPLKWFFTLATDCFSDINYRFLHESPE